MENERIDGYKLSTQRSSAQYNDTVTNTVLKLYNVVNNSSVDIILQYINVSK